MFGLASPRRLRELGIVGMNKRNVVYIARNNPRHLYPLVDDKLQTKLAVKGHDIAVPKLLGVCRVQRHIKDLAAFLTEIPAFVIKPARGSGGKGILVIASRDGGSFLKPSGMTVTLEEIKRHVSNTLSGLYSLGGHNDVAVVEELVNFSAAFDGFSFEGVPDVRVIVFQGYPVMAMTRLSTHESDGKANLHQGAVGVGIDIATGKAMKAVQHARPITHHPDTGRELSELVVPHWDEVLLIASRSYEVTGLGYLGADVVLDKHLGPLLLELNARPGLAIQIANGRGLEPRVQLATETRKINQHSAEERVEFARHEIAAL
jgi:alpha-L-glutamate ligase-like protein